jgi:hypothetical protein
MKIVESKDIFIIDFSAEVIVGDREFKTRQLHDLFIAEQLIKQTKYRDAEVKRALLLDDSSISVTLAVSSEV